MIRLYRVEPSRLSYYFDVTKSESDEQFVEQDGYWLGGGLSRVSLEGSVSRVDLEALGLGLHPHTGEQLNKYQARVRYCATDLTFATPKAVSILHALGDPLTSQMVVAAHRRSIAATMSFIERMLVAVRSRRASISENYPAMTFGSAVFEHRTSRAQDPHLHSHVLLLNLAQSISTDVVRQRGWSAFDVQPLFVHLGLLGALYRSHLRHELSASLGVRWRPIRPGWFDLDGLSGEMVTAFSQRRQEILADAARAGFTSPRATKISAAKLRRDRNESRSYAQLQQMWRDRSFRVGISAGRLRSIANRTQPSDQDHTAKLNRALIGNALISEFPRTLGATLRVLADEIPSGSSIEQLELTIYEARCERRLDVPTGLWPFGPRERSRYVRLDRLPIRALGDEMDSASQERVIGIDQLRDDREFAYIR
jgi:conjugative relaxase-like TrwC/TraI family protein